MARRRRNRSNFTGEPNGLNPGDDVGNRINQKAQAYVPDDIGNRADDNQENKKLADDVGNRIDAMPTHELSGALSFLYEGGKKGRRKPKGVTQVRVGRYVAGGVNPLVVSDQPRAQKAQEAARLSHQQSSGDGEGDEGRNKKRKRRRREGADNGADTGGLNEKRAARFFDFEEDDRYAYQLKSSPDSKRVAALSTVENVLLFSNRLATCTGTLLEDGDRPKILISIDEQGVGDRIDTAKLSSKAGEPLFALGNAALMSLNYLVNKVVNRYPDDRIRLAILPKDDAKHYLNALKEHQKLRKESSGPTANGESKKNGVGQSDAEQASPVIEDTPAEGAPMGASVDSGDDSPITPSKAGTVKKATAKKTTAKKSAAKKTATKKTPVKKATTKKTATKKTATKKVTAKKAVTKKVVTKKTTTKKVATKKTATKKTATKKTATKKATTKKATAKKTTAKKASTRK